MFVDGVTFSSHYPVKTPPFFVSVSLPLPLDGGAPSYSSYIRLKHSFVSHAGVDSRRHAGRPSM